MWTSAGRITFIRPNQIIACSLPYGMLSDDRKLSVISVVRRHLLTPKGLRTLSPRNPLYEGRCEGDQPTRDRAYHQGTVWPWLLEHYVKACFDIKGKEFCNEAVEIVKNFEEDISDNGLASISEIYDGRSALQRTRHHLAGMEASGRPAHQRDDRGVRRLQKQLLGQPVTPAGSKRSPIVCFAPARQTERQTQPAKTIINRTVIIE